MEETRQKAPGNGHFPAVLRFVAALLLSGTLCLAWGGGNLLAQIRSIYVTVDATDASIREVLESIEAQSDLRFIYADEVKPILTKVVTVREKNVSANRILDQILPDAFAVCREASTRVIGIRHYPVQIIGGIVPHQGRIAEMKTGEGKTFVAALPSYLNPLT